MILEVIWENNLLLALVLCELCNAFLIVFSYYFCVMRYYYVDLALVLSSYDVSYR
jgi:hypothetical protein